MTKNESNAHSSDLDAAREISRRLRATSSARSEGSSAPPPYLSFSLGRLGRVPTIADASRPWGSDRWNELLDRCMSICNSHAAILTDGRGLIVTQRGSVPQSRAEILAARVSLAIEQAQRLGESPDAPQTVAMEMGDHWITGISVVGPSDTMLIVTLLGSWPVSGNERAEVIRWVNDAIHT